MTAPASTLPDVDSMEAGPEMDRVVAIQVMGKAPDAFDERPEHDWKRDAKGEIDYFAYDGDEHNGPVCARCRDSFCHHCDSSERGSCKPTAPSYSTHDAAALEVLKCFAFWRLYGGDRIVCEISLDPPVTDPRPLVEVGSGETLALAIARAALKATAR